MITVLKAPVDPSVGRRGTDQMRINASSKQRAKRFDKQRFSSPRFSGDDREAWAALKTCIFKNADRFDMQFGQHSSSTRLNLRRST